MARKRYRYRTRTRYIGGRVKSGYRKRRDFFSGKMGKMLLAVGIGFGSKYIPQVLGKWTNPAVLMGAGFITKKQSIMTLGAYELGKSLQSGINIGNIGQSGNNGFYE